MRDWLAKALRLAENARDLDEVPVGAIIIQENRIIASAYNLRERDQDPCAHAELLALRKAAKRLKSWRLSDCLLVVTLEPCLMCLAAAQQGRIGHIIYGAKDPKGGAISLGYPVHQDKRINH